MLLTLDMGNTRTKAGLFQGNTLMERQVWPADAVAEQVVDWGAKHGVQAVLFSSVAEPDAELVTLLQAAWPTWELTHHTPLPFENAYDTPQTLGKDRLAAVAGAQALWPGAGCIVVDCGTCIKYEWLTAAGVYRGGNIAPGLQMRIRAMHEFTARLPLVPLQMPHSTVGHSTTTALQNGALRGAALEIEGFVRVLQEEAREPVRVVLTGGDADFLHPHLRLEGLTVVPDLVLYGLHHILRHQQNHSPTLPAAAGG